MITWEYKYEFMETDDVYLQIISYPIVLHGNSIIPIKVIRKCKNLCKVRIIYFKFSIKTTIQFFTSNTFFHSLNLKQSLLNPKHLDITPQKSLISHLHPTPHPFLKHIQNYHVTQRTIHRRAILTYYDSTRTMHYIERKID